MRYACLVLLVAAVVAVSVMQAHAVPGAQSMTMASGGHKLQVRSDGTLWAWAYNSRGQLGLGDTTDRLVPTQLGTDTDWASVAAGGYAGIGHSLALKDDGTLWAWGHNYYGQLGLGDTSNRTAPVQVGADTDWVSIAAGQGHSLAVKADGTLWAWGSNWAGQLGLGDVTNRSIPTRVGKDTDWVQAAGSSYSSYAIKTSGALYSWGYNAYGQLGLGDATTRTAPMQVGTDTDWTTVRCGESFAIGIKSTGTLWTWGDNASGQLGHGGTTARNTPWQVGTDTDWAEASGGFRHVIAVRTSGTLWSWGENYAGNLGVGDLNVRAVPTQVGAGSGWTYPMAGVNDSGALKADGSAWLWGYNLENRLGFDTVSPSRFVHPALLAAPPALATIGDKLADELVELTFTASAADADLPADTLSYSLGTGAPAGATIDAATGAFSWTPTETQGPGSYPITFAVSDGKGGTDAETITVTVSEVNAAPVLGSIGDKLADELTELTFTASATDSDIPVQSLTFSLGAGAPAGATIHAATGAFSWTPTKAQAPGSYDIAVIVSDGVATDTETITVTVSEAVDPVVHAPVFRFYNKTKGTHFYTASAQERDMVMATWSGVYAYEGIAYFINPANNTHALYRFYNKASGGHFFTASASEAASIQQKWPHIFALEGQSYAVNASQVSNSIPVYRFYNQANGSHFYTASVEERDLVIAKWSNVYKQEGTAFWLGQ